ncbi:hypothetical protein CEXT_519521 [Caerostris extrusa]|uniref:Uncharacterized protein n=1 Tax=Caerostris extrusa TaxID=172846 RepID=A0AAV4SL18_CAEEX|nr:hypothetical protein CEXT_519521 [Caerostris extrusa]
MLPETFPRHLPCKFGDNGSHRDFRCLYNWLEEGTAFNLPSLTFPPSHRRNIRSDNYRHFRRKISTLTSDLKRLIIRK